MNDNTANHVEDTSPADRWQRLKSVFLRVLECPEDRRAVFLTEACGTDREFQAEVESLLHCHAQAVDGGFLADLPESSSPRAVLEAMAAAFDQHPTARTVEEAGTANRRTRAEAARIDVPTDDTFGDYRLFEQIGQGGMGIVYRAKQVSLNRVVALKMIRAGRFSTPGEIERFAREAEAAAGLTHPGIVPVFEIGQEEGHHYFTMGLVDGLSLTDHLKDVGGPLDAKASAELIRQVADAVQYAHEHGVIHRDLKPANILLDEYGKPRVVDFGLAKQVEAESGLTFSGQILGTPSFMSPEQAGGATAAVGPATDVYSLGAVLYALLTGRPPFSAASVTETLRQVQHEDPVRPRQLNSAVPKDLETICLKCLAKEPSKRYLSARDIADELARYSEGRPIVARHVGTFATINRWCQRNRMAATFVAFVAVFVPVVIAALSWMNFQLTQESQRARFEQQMADHSFRAAQRAVNEQFTLVSEEQLLDQPGLQPLRKQLLLGAQKYYEQFLATHGDDPEVQAEAALINLRLGVITTTLSNNDELDPYAEGIRYFERARRIYERLPYQDDPRVLEGLSHVWTRIGHVRHKLHQKQAEVEAFRRALELRTSLVKVESNLENQRLLANTHMNLGQALLPDDSALPGDTTTQETTTQETTTQETTTQELATRLARREEAIKQLEIAQTIRKRLLAQAPGNAKIVCDQVKGYLFIVNSLADDQSTAIEHNLMEAFQTLGTRKQDEPPTLEDVFLRAVIARRLGALVGENAESTDDLERAREFFDLALSILVPLASDNPTVADYASALAATYYESALVLQDLGMAQPAQERLRTALKLLAPLTKDGNPDDVLRWAGAHTILAEFEPRNSAAAIQHLRDARTLLTSTLEAIANDATTEGARHEYQAAVKEIDALLAIHEGV